MKKITVIAKITSNCNLNCPYCYTKSTIKRHNPIMSLDIFEKILQNIVMYYDQAYIIFHGGEPLTVPIEWYKKALNLIDKYKEKFNTKIDLGLQTNLTLYNEEKIKLLDEHKVGIGFSYDGMTNNLTRKNDEIIINNCYKIRTNFKNQKNLNNICLVTANNYKTLEKDFKLFKLLSMKPKFNIVFNTVTMENNLTKIDMNILVEKYRNLFKEVISSKEHHYEYLFLNRIKYIYKKPINSIVCYYGDCRYKWICVHPDGNIYPCGQEWRQKNDNYLLGNINENTFHEAYNSENYKTFFKKIQEKRDYCRLNCSIYEFCQSGCPGEDFSNKGDVGIINEDMCNYEKLLMKMINDELESNKVNNENILKILGDTN